MRGAPCPSATGKGADSTAMRGGTRARARSRAAAPATDRDQAGHVSGHGAQLSAALLVPSPDTDDTDVEPSFLSRISSTGGSRAALWYRAGGRPRAPGAGD